MKSYTSFDLEDVKVPSSSIPIYAGIKPVLESSICVPSVVHGYSICVQYFRDWFLECMGNYDFKTIFVNGAHIMSDYMRYSTIDTIKKAKPRVAFTPIPDMQYDRNKLDKYMGGPNMLIRKYNHQQDFFRDYENNIFIGVGVREQKVQFDVRCQVETRAQQLDLLRKIEMNCRIGFTHKNYISADFHIPMPIISNVARAAGFKLDEKGNVEDPVEVTKYLNSHSENPITYKLRNINGKNEFFLRARRVYCHIDTTEDITHNDGETEGVLTTNFDVEFTAYLTMWVPSYYVYTSGKTEYVQLPLYDDSTVGLYTCKVIEIPETNKYGWNKYFYTEYIQDEEDMNTKELKLDISSLFRNKDLYRVITTALDIYESPEKFIEVALYNYQGKGRCYMDWDNMNLVIEDNIGSKLCIAAYIDTEYINAQISAMDKLEKTRLNQ